MLPEKISKDLANNTRKELLAFFEVNYNGGRASLKMEILQSEVTCEKCKDNDNCKFAWNAYNTNGVCLKIIKNGDN